MTSEGAYSWLDRTLLPGYFLCVSNAANKQKSLGTSEKHWPDSVRALVYRSRGSISRLQFRPMTTFALFFFSSVSSSFQMLSRSEFDPFQFNLRGPLKRGGAGTLACHRPLCNCLVMQCTEQLHRHTLARPVRGARSGRLSAPISISISLSSYTKAAPNSLAWPQPPAHIR